MDNFQTDAESIFSPIELRRPRMAVEREKLTKKFPQFDFYSHGSQDTVSHIKGILTTKRGTLYIVQVNIPAGYPYHLPKITLPGHAFTPRCPHLYNDGSLCLMMNDQWTSTLSLSFVIAKTAVWLDKYEYWDNFGVWPGPSQH